MRQSNVLCGDDGYSSRDTASIAPQCFGGQVAVKALLHGASGDPGAYAAMCRVLRDSGAAAMQSNLAPLLRKLLVPAVIQAELLRVDTWLRLPDADGSAGALEKEREVEAGHAIAILLACATPPTVSRDAAGRIRTAGVPTHSGLHALMRVIYRLSELARCHLAQQAHEEGAAGGAGAGDAIAATATAAAEMPPLANPPTTYYTACEVPPAGERQAIVVFNAGGSSCVNCFSLVLRRHSAAIAAAAAPAAAFQRDALACVAAMFEQTVVNALPAARAIIGRLPPHMRATPLRISPCSAAASSAVRSLRFVAEALAASQSAALCAATADVGHPSTLSRAGWTSAHVLMTSGAASCVLTALLKDYGAGDQARMVAATVDALLAHVFVTDHNDVYLVDDDNLEAQQARRRARREDDASVRVVRTARRAAGAAAAADSAAEAAAELDDMVAEVHASLVASGDSRAGRLAGFFGINRDQADSMCSAELRAALNRFNARAAAQAAAPGAAAAAAAAAAAVFPQPPPAQTQPPQPQQRRTFEQLKAYALSKLPEI